ncbi:hypothetical protein HDU86_003440 [Geranomyces michiganensis]|nr:hypothetical protein HDU86_003440 [Geranomyces michiganensis]
MRRSPRHRISYALRDTNGPLQPHSAGINSLALDTTTTTTTTTATAIPLNTDHGTEDYDSRPRPRDDIGGGGGILYTAGRDSVVNAWNCHIDFARHREIAHAREMMDRQLQRRFEEDEDEEDGFAAVSIPMLDRTLLQTQTGGGGGSPAGLRIPKAPPTLIRSFQHHSGWVNDIVLVDNNQHIVTASNDRTIFCSRADQTNAPTAIGVHADYVKCLAYSRHARWVASAGLDHHVFLWDLEYGGRAAGGGDARGGLVSEMTGVSFAHDLLDDEGRTSSVYALACNPSGSILVSGSTDKSIRVWDHRTKTCVMRLQGHTDNIRSLLVSDDGQRVLSASCDRTVKLWSLANAANRPLHTYSHFEDSVYCLYSTHPDLDTFWTGARDGWVTKVSRSKTVDTSDDLMEVVAICKEDSPVQKIVAINDMYIWTATTKSTVNRWRDIPFQHVDFADPARSNNNNNNIAQNNSDNDDDDDDDDRSGRVLIPKSAMLTIPNVGNNNNGTLDGDATSIMTQGYYLRPYSVCGGRSFMGGGAHNGGGGRNGARDTAAGTHQLHHRGVKDTSVMVLAGGDGDDEGDELHFTDEIPVVEPAWREPDARHVGVPGIRKSTILNDRRHLVTEDEGGEVALWDIVGCTKLVTSRQPFDQVVQEHQTLDWIPNWCTIDTHKGFIVVHLEETNCFDAEMHLDQTGVPVKVPPDRVTKGEELRVCLGKWVLTLLLKKYTDAVHAVYKSSSAKERYSRRKSVEHYDDDDEEDEEDEEEDGEDLREGHRTPPLRAPVPSRPARFFSGLRPDMCDSNASNSGANAFPPNPPPTFVTVGGIASPGIHESPRVPVPCDGVSDTANDDARREGLDGNGEGDETDGCEVGGVTETTTQEEQAYASTTTTTTSADAGGGASWTLLTDGNSDYSDRAELRNEDELLGQPQGPPPPQVVVVERVLRSVEGAGEAEEDEEEEDILFTIPPPPVTAPPPEAFSAASSYSSLYVRDEDDDGKEREHDLHNDASVWPEGEEDSLRTHRTEESASTNADGGWIGAGAGGDVGYNAIAIPDAAAAADAAGGPAPASTTAGNILAAAATLQHPSSTPPASGRSSPSIVHTPPSFIEKIRSQVRRRASSTRSEELTGGGASGNDWSSMSSSSGGGGGGGGGGDNASRRRRAKLKHKDKERPGRPARTDSKGRLMTLLKGSSPSPSPSPSRDEKAGFLQAAATAGLTSETASHSSAEQPGSTEPSPGESPSSNPFQTGYPVDRNAGADEQKMLTPTPTPGPSPPRPSAATTVTAALQNHIPPTSAAPRPLRPPCKNSRSSSRSSTSTTSTTTTTTSQVSRSSSTPAPSSTTTTSSYIDQIATPLLPIPRGVPFMISKEESPEDAAFLDVYHGVVGQLGNRAWNLQAPRQVRMRKLLAYVAGKVPEAAPPGMAGDPLAAAAHMEMVFNNEPVDPLLTLAGLKQHFWDGRGGFVIYYRQKAVSLPPAEQSTTLA